jgi:hypothetical protein
MNWSRLIISKLAEALLIAELMAKFLSKPNLVAITASIGMSTLGSSVWLSGSHSPSADSEDTRKYAEFAIDSHIDILVNLAKTADLNLGQTSRQ